MTPLEGDIRHISAIDSVTHAEQDVRERFRERLFEPGLTREENISTHYCVYFLPYDLAAQKLFFILHKKAGIWLAPGGHIDKGENLLTTLRREKKEELSIDTPIAEREQEPFLLTIENINNPVHLCREHLDIWYRFSTTPEEVKPDMAEFDDARWVTIEEARALVTNANNLRAIDRMELFFKAQ